MRYSLILIEQAHEEYIEAYKWYEIKQIGLGERFMKCVEERISQIKEHPEYFGKRYSIYREAKVRDFPYMIVYEVHKRKKIILVNSIYHSKRNPLKKYRKTR